MHFKILLPLLLSLPALASAQSLGSSQQTVEVAREFAETFDNGFNVVSYDLRGAQVRGNPFLTQSWMPGEVLLLGNRKSTQVPLKYDLVRQQLRVRRTQGDSIIVPVNQVREFTLTGVSPAGSFHQRRFVHYTDALVPPELKDVCLEVLDNGQQVQLLKFWRKIVVKSQESGVNMAVSTTVRTYEDNAKYYLRWVGDGKMTEVRPKRASLQVAMASYPAAQQALKSRKVGSEAELREAVAALDPLLVKVP